MAIPLALAPVTAVTGCAGREGGEGTADAGAAPGWGEDEAWRVEAEPSVVIGDVDGPPERSFGEIGRPARLSDGRIVVPDIDAGEIRWFDADGGFLMRRGGQGDGPGEYRWPEAVLALPGDTVLVNDLDGARVTWLTPDGRVARMERPPEPERWQPEGSPVARRESRPRIRGAFSDGSLLLRSVAFRGWPERVGQRWADSLGWFRWTPTTTSREPGPSSTRGAPGSARWTSRRESRSSPSEGTGSWGPGRARSGSPRWWSTCSNARRGGPIPTPPCEPRGATLAFPL